MYTYIYIYTCIANLSGLTPPPKEGKCEVCLAFTMATGHLKCPNLHFLTPVNRCPEPRTQRMGRVWCSNLEAMPQPYTKCSYLSQSFVTLAAAHLAARWLITAQLQLSNSTNCFRGPDPSPKTYGFASPKLALGLALLSSINPLWLFST